MNNILFYYMYIKTEKDLKLITKLLVKSNYNYDLDNINDNFYDNCGDINKGFVLYFDLNDKECFMDYYYIKNGIDVIDGDYLIDIKNIILLYKNFGLSPSYQPKINRKIDIR